MTNVTLLRAKITESGLKLLYIAEQLGMTPQGLSVKLKDGTDWKSSQIVVMKKLLNLTDDEVNRIFLAQLVD